MLQYSCFNYWSCPRTPLKMCIRSVRSRPTRTVLIYSQQLDTSFLNTPFICPTCAAKSPVCPTCNSMAWQSRSQARWDQTFQLHIGRLGKHASNVDLRLTYHNFDIFLKELEGKCAQSGTGKFLSATFLSHIEQFTAAISSMSQANQIACLVWGSLQALLKVQNSPDSKICVNIKTFAS